MQEKNISSIEGLLLVASKPLSYLQIKKILNLKNEEIEEVVAVLKNKYNQSNSGIHLLVNNNEIQLTTSPDDAEMIKEFLKEEISGELTKPSLETLTIIAYRQPIKKEELEQIRGVNCSLIIRNLLLRGLIDAKEDEKKMTVEYNVTMDFLKYLGINNVSELPDFDKLNSDENLLNLLASREKANINVNL